MHDSDYPTPIDDEGLARYINCEVELSGVDSFILMRSPDGIYRLDSSMGSMELQGGEVLQVIEGGRSRKFRYEPAGAAEDSDRLNETQLWEFLCLGKPVKAEVRTDRRVHLLDVEYKPRIGFIVRHGEDVCKPLPDGKRVFAYGREHKIAYENHGLLPWMEPQAAEPGNGAGSPYIIDEEDLMTLMLAGATAAIDGVEGEISFDFRRDNFCIRDRTGSRHALCDEDGIDIIREKGLRSNRNTTQRYLLRLSNSRKHSRVPKDAT